MQPGRRSRFLSPRASALLAAAVILAPAAGPAAAEEPAAVRVRPGPEQMASRDGDFHHIEPTVTAHPTDPETLLASAMVFPRPDRGSGCRVYVSHDGGTSWRGETLAPQGEQGLGDPQVAFTPRGTAIFSCLAMVESPGGRIRAALMVYRSEDKGRTWEAPTTLAARSHDHPVLTVDTTTGRHAGHLYVALLHSLPEGHGGAIGVYRSEDDGRSFIGPVEIAREGTEGLLVTSADVLADGTLVVGYRSSPPARGVGTERREERLWTVASSDGGVRFSAPRPVARRILAPRGEELVSRLGSVPTGVSGPGADGGRLYQVWNDHRSGAWRVMLAASADGGATWSEPRPVDPEVPAGAQQFLPVAAVDGDGVLGIAYLDSRGFASGAGYHQRFIASLDAGASFLPSVQISRRPSRPERAAARDRVTMLSRRGPSGRMVLAFTSVAGRWPLGGDYMGLAADASGVFHPLWADSRAGTFQLWTAPVRLERPAAEAAPGARSYVERRIDGRIELVADPITWDAASGEIEAPIRLKNVSGEPIRPPLAVEVLRVAWREGWKEGLSPEEIERRASQIPEILNADNGESGAGARFDYGEALGGLEALAPGGITEPRVWRLRGPKEAMAPIRFTVRGAVPER